MMDLINEYQQYQNAGVYEEGEDEDEYTEEYQHWEVSALTTLCQLERMALQR